MLKAVSLALLVGLVGCSSGSDAGSSEAPQVSAEDAGSGTGCLVDCQAAGGGCKATSDCAEGRCVEGVCAAPTPTDGIRNGTETDIDCGGSNAPACATGRACAIGSDCVELACTGGTCTAASPTDGVRNGTETDVDCGGGAAPACAATRTCAVADDCDSRFCTDAVCEARQTGRKDGDETDIDCGGKVAPACDWDRVCLADGDCTSGACKAGKCLTGPSCRADNGGQTCGPDGVGDCCRSLPVTTFAKQNGKTVYVDKFEITAGRMRAFIDHVTAAQGGAPNVRGYMAAHRPTRWNAAWEAVLPQASGVGNNQPTVTYTITNPTPTATAVNGLSGPLYPADDVLRQQWTSIGQEWNYVVRSGSWPINPGLVQTFGEYTFFPEYTSNSNHATYHAVNCSNETGDYGFGTYWLPLADLKALSVNPARVLGRGFTQAEADRKSLNCTTNAMFAAFCAWDGGELASDAVMAHLVTGRLQPRSPDCGGGILTANDTTTGCYSTWYQPSANTADDSGRYAPPGRITADVIKTADTDEGWNDLKGNLLEVTLKPDDTFSMRGDGIGWGSISHHRAQILTARGKYGSLGARCMRLK